MKFKLGDKKLLFKGKYINLWGREFGDGSGNSHVWEYMEKRDVVFVLPVTDDGKAILIKNYRVPLEKYVIETPAGLMDKESESREDAVKRELLEETGYEASEWHALPPQPYRSGSSKNLMYGFIAKGLKKVKDGITGDDTEDISIMEVPLKDLVRLWLNPSDDIFFEPEIIAMYQAGIEMGLLK
ncbi:MAG: NUDIX hydrolase [Patescibacteria group bacterium]|nr:NUDIX hydrolase [Patescibacteria group bacterium]MDE2015650.1 NUDIX hydrolase [Patescibacteria group bacterium]MDE2226707.1 NUDIX hydrolase [Patescibacteria group bacterium]